jgi:ADP-ribosylglycohydrolase
VGFGEDIRELVTRELAQAHETGHDVAALQQRFADLAEDDLAGCEQLYQDILLAPRSPGWAYDEPDDIAAFLHETPADERGPHLGDDECADKVLGGWLGRIVGCTVGKPVENGDHWTPERLRAYLQLAGAWPLRDYIPVLDPMPDDCQLRESWPETTRGRVRGGPRDDDIDYSIVGLHLLERHGGDFSTGDVATAWLSLLPHLQVFTAERIAYRNLLAGLPVSEAGSHRNPCREWIGALIRADAFGWSNPGRPRQAATLAARDAALSHVANGIYGEMWSAALVAAAFTATSLREAFDRALAFVPAGSRLAAALTAVRGMADQGESWESAVAAIHRRWSGHSWAHTVNNAAIIAAGLLWSEDDYATAVGLTVSGGLDTDSNGATAGSVMGVLCGARALPRHFVDPLDDRVRSAVFGYDNSSITELARRTLVLAKGLTAVS